MRARAAVAVGVCLAAATTSAGIGTTAAAATRPDVLRTGGPSEPTDPKIAVFASMTAHAGAAFRVLDAGNAVVFRGRLERRPKPAPWKFAYHADWSAVTAPGSYRVRVGTMVSNRWAVRAGAGREAVPILLGFFDANRDGGEPSALHGPAHMHDAKVRGGAHDGQAFDLTGGWMDAGDMLHFTETTAYATVVLQLAAQSDAVDAAALSAEADVGVRWLMKAHPAAGLFIGQVGDERDHIRGWRDPAADDASAVAGVGVRFAYPSAGSSLSGKAAAALALAAERSSEPQRAQYLAAARQWYAAGVATSGFGPAMPGAFYVASSWRDDLALGAVMLYRATGEVAYRDEAVANLRVGTRYDAMGWDNVAPIAGADLCGALGHATVDDATARRVGCARLHEVAAVARARSASNPWGMAGYYSWGATATSSGGAVAIALDYAAGRSASRAAASRARDYNLGLNQFGASFIVGYGQSAPVHPHHWANVFGDGLPRGAVVGGPAPKRQSSSRGFPITNVFSRRGAAYQDNALNYVTSEPALDYTVNTLWLHALAGDLARRR